MTKYNAKTRSIANQIIDFELADLRRSLDSMDAKPRSTMTGLCVVSLMLDLPAEDRDRLLAMLPAVYFNPSNRS
jgi:hypothetical protein